MRGMRLLSTDGDSTCLLERREFGDFTQYSFSVRFAGQSLANESVVFTEIPQFLTALESFAQTRKGIALLDGSEDCWLKIEADGSAGHAWCSFQVRRIVSARSPQTGNLRTGHITLQGSFPVAGEEIYLSVEGFKRVFSDSKSNDWVR